MAAHAHEIRQISTSSLNVRSGPGTGYSIVGTVEEIGEYLKIAETCRAEMAKSGECGAGWWLVGRVRHLVGDLREATAAYDAGLRAEPGHAACQLYKARLEKFEKEF